MKVFIDTTKWVNVREERAIPTLVGNNYVDKIEVYYNSNPATDKFYPSLNILKSNGRRLSDIGFDSANPTYPRTFIDDDNVTWYYFVFTLSSERGLLDVTGQYQISITTNFYDDNNTITAQRNINTILNVKNAVKSSNGKVLIFSDNPADDVVDVKNEINNLKTSSANLSANKADRNNPEQTIIANQVNANGFKQNGNDVLDETDVIDNLTTNDATKVLSAKQGKVLKDRVEEIADSQVLEADIVDNLNSDDSQKVLSAKQGKVLKGMVDDIHPENFVEKTSTSNKVYGTDGSGNQTTLGYGIGAIENNLVQRTSTGAIIVPASPLDDSHAISKSYLDNTIENVNLSIQNVMEVAEGKTNNYVISDANPSVPADYNWVNNLFNSTNATIYIPKNGDNSEPNYIKQADNTAPYIKIQDLKTGDIISITETDVPDRWAVPNYDGNYLLGVTFYPLETKLNMATSVTSGDTRPITSGAVYTALHKDIGYVELSILSSSLTDTQIAEMQKKYCIIKYEGTTYYKMADDYAMSDVILFQSLTQVVSGSENVVEYFLYILVNPTTESKTVGTNTIPAKSFLYTYSNVSFYSKSQADTLLAAKQDTISDLATIRSNASDGKEAYDTLSSVDINSNETEYIKDVPSSAKGLATLGKVGGMSYKSENKFVIPDIAEQTTNGITWKVENGILSFNGTATASFSINLLQYCEQTTNVNIKFFDIQGTSSKSSITQINNNYSSPTTSGISIVNLTIFRFFTDSGQSFTNYSYKVMVVNGSTAPSEWQLGFDGIRDSAVTNVVSKGANIANGTITNGLAYGSNGGIYNSSNTKIMSLVEVKPNTTYSKNNAYWVNFYDTNKNFISQTPNNTSTFTTPSNCYYLGITALISSDIMLNKGLTVLPYTPYKVVATQPIASEIQALEGYGWGVNDTCYNYIDYEAKKFVQKVGRVDLGSLTWIYNSGYGGRWYSSDISTLVKAFATMSTIPNILYTNGDVYTPTDLLNNQINGATIYTNGDVIIKNGSDTTQPSGYLYYELATPVETDVSSYIGDKHIPIEANGSLTFTNTYNQAVPSTITFDCGLVEVVKTNHEHDIEQQKDIDTLKENKQDRLYLHHISINCVDGIVKGIKFKLLRRSDTPLTLTDLRNESITEIKAFDRVAQIYLNNKNYYSPIDTLQFYAISETFAFNIGYSSQASNGILDTDNVEVDVADVISVTDTVTPL